LIDAYDAALFDLDGVVYLGPVAVPAAVAALAQLRSRGTKIGFVTNNAARAPGVVVEHLRELGIAAQLEDVVTSAQAGAHLLRDRFGPGAKVLVVGGEGITAALTEVGLVGVHSADDDPVAVIQGYGFDLTWNDLNEACIAIQRGAHWLATNTDSTRPTERGLVPGNGAAVDAVRAAVDVDPEVAGKPFRPLIDETMVRLGTKRPIFVGDRIDTDIAGAVRVGIDSLLVLSGAHGARDLLAAGPGARPTHIGLDVAALLEPPRTVSRVVNRAICRKMSAVATQRSICLETAPSNTEDALDALWAAARLMWESRDRSRVLDPTPALAALEELT
jgi:HAD superfamily hydrolase (TIGR01450 family)